MARNAVLALASLVAVLLAPTCTPDPVDRDRHTLPGLSARARVSTDALGVPHVVAETLEDATRVQGYLHARDRFFQMDLRRRQADGRSAELLGTFPSLLADAQTRILGFRAAAERSAALLTAREQQILQAYADGVNAWLAANPLPPEYAQLEITNVEAWQPLDSLLIGKAAPALLAPFAYEMEDSRVLESYRTALGEDVGTTLYLEEAARFAPIDPNATVPDAGGSIPFAAGSSSLGAPTQEEGLARSSELVAAASGMRARRGAAGLAGEGPFARHAPRRSAKGSNAWGVAAWQSESGAPLVAGDSHLELSAPSRSYEMHISVGSVSDSGPLNVSGVTLAGLAVFAAAQTDHLAWAGTNFLSDVSDYFTDRLVRDAPGCPVQLCIESAGTMHPVEQRSETYLLNQLDGVPDNSIDVTSNVAALAPEATQVLTVPFRGWGPITEVADRSVIDDPAPSVTETDVITLQYTGFLGTREVAAFNGLLEARTVAEFQEALRFMTAVTSNWVVADTAGSLAYFTTGEIPLRADLEAGSVFGDLPTFLRDGSGPANWIPDPGRSQGQVLPYRVVPRDEMPQVIDPPSGFVVNANNDPSGVELDNDLANEFRPSSPGSIYYLGATFSPGLRSGRITRLLRQKFDAGEKISLEDMKRIQTNTQGLDAEILVPLLVDAWRSATAPGAPAAFGPVAADTGVAEAVDRLGVWDFSMPTGIPEGYDASDVDGVRAPVVSPEEAASSVAATLYAAWRAELIERTVIATLTSLGLQESFPQGSFVGLVHLLRQDPFTGVGASGIDFFPEPAGEDAAVRRDLVILEALRGALDLLTSNRYDLAFGNSTNQDDYRWGLLNRVQLEHPLGRPSSIPPAGGFEDASPQLLGIPRDGGYQTVNLGHGNPSTQGENAFVFSQGSEYRQVLAVGDSRARPDGVLGFFSLAGGSSGDPGDPLYASQLGRWLTADHHRVPMNRRDVRDAAERVELFVPGL